MLEVPSKVNIYVALEGIVDVNVPDGEGNEGDAIPHTPESDEEAFGDAPRQEEFDVLKWLENNIVAMVTKESI